jgi:hypothetical protein
LLNEIMLFVGSGLIIVWGVAHLIPTKAIVNGFGPISVDNKRIIAMESIAEGLTLIFLGVVVLLVTVIGGYQNTVSAVVYWSCSSMLIVMALLTMLTGARTSILPYKICPVVKTAAATLFILGILL